MINLQSDADYFGVPQLIAEVRHVQRVALLSLTVAMGLMILCCLLVASLGGRRALLAKQAELERSEYESQLVIRELVQTLEWVAPRAGYATGRELYFGFADLDLPADEGRNELVKDSVLRWRRARLDNAVRGWRR